MWQGTYVRKGAGMSMAITLPSGLHLDMHVGQSVQQRCIEQLMDNVDTCWAST